MAEKDKAGFFDKMPPVAMLEAELARSRYRSRYKKVLRSTVFTLITVAAVAVLVATLWMPVYQVSGTSMTPTLTEDDIVICRKSKKFDPGEVVAFYFNNKVLVKRVIASAGDIVDIDENGNVYVNGNKLDEPYVDELAFGECDIDLPYMVPESRYFVIGDHRAVSIDSRNKSVGCITAEDIVGKIIFCVWPRADFGKVEFQG